MLRHLARALVGAAYVQQGIEQVRHPHGPAEAARPYVSRLSERTPLPDDPALLVRVAGGLTVVAGLGLVTNTAPRTSATALACLALPATLLRAPVRPADWRALGGEEGTRLLTELGLVGGAVVVALDTGERAGARRARPRAERASRRARREAEHQRRAARREARTARREARLARQASASAVPETDR